MFWDKKSYNIISVHGLIIRKGTLFGISVSSCGHFASLFGLIRVVWHLFFKVTHLFWVTVSLFGCLAPLIDNCVHLVSLFRKFWARFCFTSHG